MPASSKVRERDNGQASTLSLARARGGATVGFWQDERQDWGEVVWGWAFIDCRVAQCVKQTLCFEDFQISCA